MNNLSGYGDTFIGHNIALFDFRMIRQRAMVLGIKAPEFMPFDAKPWDDKIYDTLHRWDSRKEAMIGLDKLCRAFGVPGKAGFDGSMVYQAFQNGLHEQIADYCKGDVERVRAVYRRMHGAS